MFVPFANYLAKKDSVVLLGYMEHSISLTKEDIVQWVVIDSVYIRNLFSGSTPLAAFWEIDGNGEEIVIIREEQ